MTDIKNRAMYELAPRYQRSEVLGNLFSAAETVWQEHVQPLADELALCRDFATMPLWLLERYAVYFGFADEQDEGKLRDLLAWRLRTLSGLYKLDEMLRALGFADYRYIRHAGAIVFTLYTRQGAEGTARQVTDGDVAEFCRALDKYGPAHLKTTATIGTTPTFGTATTFGKELLFGLEG